MQIIRTFQITSFNQSRLITSDMKCTLFSFKCSMPKSSIFYCILLFLFGTMVYGSVGVGKDELPNWVSEESDFFQTTISGVVTDENGLPLPGASIIEKGTTNGTTTDFDGNYSITLVGPNSTLVFSYIGYLRQEFDVGSSSNLNVQLEPDSSELDEVVVIGYGTQKKAEVTNAVSQVEGPVLKQTPAISVSNSIAGQIPGVFAVQSSGAPGFDDSDIRVRGSSTFGSAPVLYVIDGVANRDPDNLNRIDPNDIESLTVLKDASAAIYGAQSAGGVILVTTKRGKAGKAKFSYNFDQGFSRPISQPNTANAFQYINIVNSADLLDGRDPTFSNAQVDLFRTGVRTSTDWWDELIGGRVLEQNRHSLNVSGGSENTKYFVSAGHAVLTWLSL